MLGNKINFDDAIIWLDGNYLTWKQAQVPVFNYTLQYGLGVFEGIRAYKTTLGPAIFRATEHIDRFYHSAHILQLNIINSPDELIEVQNELLARNNLSNAYIKPMLFCDSGGYLGIRQTGLSSHLVMAAIPWNIPIYSEKKLQQGICLQTSTIVRNGVRSNFNRAKTNGAYLNILLAIQEAFANGFDDCLLLDTEGYVAEACGANFFIVKNDKLFTPELTSCLDGITRRTIIDIASDLNYKVVEKRITRDEVYAADEAFLTGTAVEVVPVQSLDRRLIGLGECGLLTKKLMEEYQKAVHNCREIQSVSNL